MNVDIIEVSAEESLLDLFAASLWKLPRKNTAPFLRVSTVQAVAEGQKVKEAIARCDDAVRELFVRSRRHCAVGSACVGRHVRGEMMKISRVASDVTRTVGARLRGL